MSLRRGIVKRYDGRCVTGQRVEGIPSRKKEDIKPAFEKMMNSEGPGFLLIKVEPCFDSKTGRVTHTPEEITKRFMKSLRPATGGN